MDEKCERAIEELKICQLTTCKPAEKLKNEIEHLLTLFKGKGNCFKDSEKELKDLLQQLEEKVDDINYSFDSVKIRIKKYEDDPFEIIEQFRSNKIDVRQRIAPIKIKFEEIEDNCEQKIEKFCKYQERLKHTVNQVKTKAADLVVEIDNEISKTSNNEVRFQLNAFKNNIRDITNAFDNIVSHSNRKIRNAKDYKVWKTCVDEFESSANSIFEQLRVQRETMLCVLCNSSTGVRASNENNYKTSGDLTGLEVCDVSQQIQEERKIDIKESLDEEMKTSSEHNEETTMISELQNVKEVASGDLSELEVCDVSQPIQEERKIDIKESLDEEMKTNHEHNVETIITELQKVKEDTSNIVIELKQKIDDFLQSHEIINYSNKVDIEEKLNLESSKLRSFNETLTKHYESEKTKIIGSNDGKIQEECANEFLKKVNTLKKAVVKISAEFKEIEKDVQNFQKSIRNLNEALNLLQEETEPQINMFINEMHKLISTPDSDMDKTTYIEQMSHLKILLTDLQKYLGKTKERIAKLTPENVKKLQEKLLSSIGCHKNLVLNRIEEIRNNYSEVHQQQQKHEGKNINIEKLAAANLLVKKSYKLFKYITEEDTIEKELKEITELIKEALKNSSDTLEKLIADLKKSIECVMEKYNINDQMILAESILEESTKMKRYIGESCGLHIYKFPLNETYTIDREKLRRFEFGQPQPNVDHHNILLVGMTGVGKSLLINNMVNYIYGVRHEDTFRFKLIVESEEIAERDAGASSSQAESMTSWVSSFTFHWQEGFRIPYSITIIDTPGFGDTRGVEYDEQIIMQIKKFVNNSNLYPCQELSSIGLLIQASQARITEEQKYVYDQVLNLFGKDVSDNIFLIFTFADAQPPPAEETVKANKIPFAKGCTFKFNNSALYAPNDEPLSKHGWKFGFANLEKYFYAFGQTKPIDLTLTKKVMNEQDHLKIALEALHVNISNGLETLCLIEEQSRTILNLEGSILSNQNYKIKTRTILHERIKCDTYITHCSKCNVTCHKECYIQDDRKQSCSAMKNDYCVICPNKCHYNFHRNGNMIYIYTPIETEETIGDMMMKYNVAVTEKCAKLNVLKCMLEEYKKQKDEVVRCIQTASCHFNRLEQITLRASNTTNVVFIERLIEKEHHDSKPNKTNRLKQLYHLKQITIMLNTAGENFSSSRLPLSEYEAKIQKIIEEISYDQRRSQQRVNSSTASNSNTTQHVGYGRSNNSRNQSTSGAAQTGQRGKSSDTKYESNGWFWRR